MDTHPPTLLAPASVVRARPPCVLARALIAGALLGPLATPQWNPSRGDWAPASAHDLRIATFNVNDGICSSADKSGADNSWTALAMIVAALEPDVLLLQETGDNSGNGTGQGVDSVADLEETLRLFVRGGHDVFTPGAPPVGASVQDFAPQLRLPYVAVSTRTDGFNRNALLSRYPFADLNGDGVAAASDMPSGPVGPPAVAHASDQHPDAAAALA